MAYQLGPCEIIDITSGGAGTSLGRTSGGVSVKIEESSVSLHTDQDGEVPVDEVITGTKVTIEASLANITLENLALMLKTTVNANVVKVKPNVGTSLLQNAKVLLIKPYKNGVLSTDKKDFIFIPKAGIRASLDLNYNSKDQRTIKMSITGYPDSTLTGSPAAIFGVSTRAEASSAA